MTTISDIIDFRDDLFFGGAVHIDWFERDMEKRNKAASNFVFHGPEYFGINDEDKKEAVGYSLTDSVRMTSEIIDRLDPQKDTTNPIALAIAGYGAGKSHFSLTLATLLSEPRSTVAQNILSNIEKADTTIGRNIRQSLVEWSNPVLVIPINGMNNFDLSDELSRQVLIQLRAKGLDTGVIEDLWPRFQIAEAFVERNFSLWKEKFIELFDPDITDTYILGELKNHNDIYFKKVNDIYKHANGLPIPVTGAESPKQLIDTVCQQYCGENGPFQSLLILFDEFGRFLQFAVEKPHIAGDAALQQIFEGVQDNSEQCFMLCTIQYELKTYISRVSPEHHNTITRFVGRYDASKKYYLSSNTETLFAHLIEKKDPEYISDHILESNWKALHSVIQNLTPRIRLRLDSVWRDTDRFRQVIVEGCWPLHPMATLFLCCLGDQLQQRSAVAFVADVIKREKNRILRKDAAIVATRLFQLHKGTEDPLLQELISTEQYAVRGSAAYAYSAVEEKYRNDLSNTERHTLLSILISDKMGLKVSDKSEAHQLSAILSGIPVYRIETAVKELVQEYGVLEWNERFVRYEIISDAIPRSAFTRFLDRKTKEISSTKIEDLFVMHIRKLVNLPYFQEIDPEFASKKKIRTTEWRFKTHFSNQARIDSDIITALKDWKIAVKTDEHRGQLIYCYVPANANIEQVHYAVAEKFETHLKEQVEFSFAPMFIILIYDEEERLRQALSEYWVLIEGLTQEETQTYRHFIEDQKQRLSDELSLACKNLTEKRQYVLPRNFFQKPSQIMKTTYSLFDQIYDKVMPFPFDGFHTSKGAAAKDCREMTVELFKGTLDHEWYTSRPKKLQNRAKAVLVNAWDTFQNNRIALYPNHSELKEIIADFETKLKKQDSLNLGEMFNHLISPPYGFNIASAGLVLGIFICPRIETTALLYEGESIAPSVWVNEAIPKNFIETGVLDKTNIQHVETDEWQELLTKWVAEMTHSGRVEYLKQSESLMKRLPLPSGVLQERYKNLEEKAVQSLDALKKYEKHIEDQGRYYQIALEKQDVANLSRVGKKMAEYEKKMADEEEYWTGEQVEIVSKLIDKSRGAVKAYFDSWIREQSCLSTNRIERFRHTMLDLVGGNLKSLDFNDLYERLESYTIEIINDIKTRQRVFYIVEETRAFLSSHQVTQQSKVSELIGWIQRCNQLKADLERARTIRNVPEIDASILQIDEFQKNCNRQKKKQRDQRDELLYRPFLSIDDIRNGRSEIRDLMTIFSGQDLELEELSQMESKLSEIENDFSFWNNLAIPTDELNSLVKSKIDEIPVEDDPDELPIRDIYENLLNHLLSERQSRSTEWTERIYQSSEEISQTTADGCQNLLSRIEAMPAFISQVDREKVEEMRKNLQKRVGDLKVEGLLALFRPLPNSLQKQFYEIISSEI